MTLSSQDREDHAATDKNVVSGREKRLDDTEFVGDLGPTEYHRVRVLHSLSESCDNVDLAFNQQACNAGAQRWKLHYARLLAVDDTKAVRHHEVNVVSPLRSQSRTLAINRGRLSRVEAQVLDYRDTAGRTVAHPLEGLGAGDVIGEPHRFLNQLSKTCGNRGK